MSIVIRFTDSGISMILFNSGSEPFRKFWSMVRLKHVKSEDRFSLRFVYKSNGLSTIHFLIRSCIDPSREYINEYKHIQSFLLINHPVNGINLHQITRFKGIWTIYMGMISFPLTSLF